MKEAVLPPSPLVTIAEWLIEGNGIRLHTDIHGHLPSLTRAGGREAWRDRALGVGKGQENRDQEAQTSTFALMAADLVSNQN